MNPLTELLAGRDRWSGASCVGLWATHDPRRDDETADDYEARVHHARAICTTCPLLEQCHEYASNARPRDRAGTWAGVPYDSSGRPVRIPSKESK